ncbi:hypothetical protein D3C78_1835220 [compost metagenome]
MTLKEVTERNARYSRSLVYIDEPALTDTFSYVDPAYPVCEYSLQGQLVSNQDENESIYVLKLVHRFSPAAH